MDFGYFEKQNNRDCTLHSLNNAFGKVIISKDEVLEYIDKQSRRYQQSLEKTKGYSKKQVQELVLNFKEKMCTQKTYFSAEITWKAAQKLGRIGDFIKLDGYAKCYADVNKTFMEWAKELPVVVLGGVLKKRSENTTTQHRDETSENDSSNYCQVNNSDDEDSLYNRHAIAVRNHLIYDSGKNHPLDLTNENMNKCLDIIFAAYAFFPIKK